MSVVLLAGALPVEWQVMTLQILIVVGNGLNGTLPTGCAAFSLFVMNMQILQG